MSAKKTFNYIVAALLVTLFVAYSNHFQNGFHFDDFHTIVNNGHIRKLSNIPSFFVDPTMFSVSPNHQGLRPLVTTTLALDYWMGGDLDPFYFQLSTFLWHIGLCIILFFIYKALLSIFIHHKWVSYIALFGVAWFGLHTAGAETINYIISRSDVLSTFFILLSFYIFIAYPQKRKFYGYIIPAIIGVFAKETVPVLVILLFFYILLFEKNLSVADLFKRANFKKILQTVVQLLPIIIVIILVQLYTLTAIKAQSLSFGISNPVGYYWLTQTYVWFHYFKSFFLPTRLSADTDLGVITTIWSRKILIGIIFMALLVFTIIKTSAKARTRPVSFGLIWFAASLLPTSLAPFAEVMNDHRMYFAFTGLSLSVVSAAGIWLMDKEKMIIASKTLKALLIAVPALILVLNAYGVFQRNKVWKTEASLWYDVTQKSPLNGRGLMNYGLSQMAMGKYNVAMEYFQKAQQLLPTYNLLYVNMGIAAGGLRKHAEAENYFKAAIALSPTDFSAYSFYARYLVENGKMAEAKTMAERALALNPNDEISLNAQLAVLQYLQMWNELEKLANYKLSVFPNDETALQFLNFAKQKTPAAPATANTPKTAADYINLSLAMYNIGAFEECIKACKEALKLDPNAADAYSNMCAAYNSLQQWDKGLEACKKALSINPDHQFAQGNLKWSISRKNQ